MGNSGVWGAAALDLVLPPLCMACREPVDAPGRLCAACWSAVDFIADPACCACGLPFDNDIGSQAVCAACARRRMSASGTAIPSRPVAAPRGFLDADLFPEGIVYTRHAEARMKQRGIRESDISPILDCGARIDDET